MRAGGTKITPLQNMSDNGPLSLEKVKEHFGKLTYDQVPPRQWVLLLAGSWECSALHSTALQGRMQTGHGQARVHPARGAGQGSSSAGIPVETAWT